jgi:hypothetical protein
MVRPRRFAALGKRTLNGLTESSVGSYADQSSAKGKRYLSFERQLAFDEED